MRNTVIALFVGLIMGTALQCGQSSMPTAAGADVQDVRDVQDVQDVQGDGRYQATSVAISGRTVTRIYVTIIDTRTGEVFRQVDYSTGAYD